DAVWIERGLHPRAQSGQRTHDRLEARAFPAIAGRVPAERVDDAPDLGRIVLAQQPDQSARPVVERITAQRLAYPPTRRRGHGNPPQRPLVASEGLDLTDLGPEFAAVLRVELF